MNTGWRPNPIHITTSLALDKYTLDPMNDAWIDQWMHAISVSSSSFLTSFIIHTHAFLHGAS